MAHQIKYKTSFFGTIWDNPIDPDNFIRDEIYYNADGDVVELRSYFYDKNGAEVARTKRIIPASGDETPVGNPKKIYAWKDYV